jgi:hypothetical protein
VSTLEERVAALEAAQVRRGNGTESRRAELLGASERFASLKVFGILVDDRGCRVHYMPREAEELAKWYSKEMERISVALLHDMSREEVTT